MAAVARVIKFAKNSFSHSVIAVWKSQFGIPITPLLLSMQACRLRAARNTFKDIGLLFQMLSEASAFLPFGQHVSGSISPLGWDTQPIVATLRDTNLLVGFNNSENKRLTSRIEYEEVLSCVGAPIRQKDYLAALCLAVYADWEPLLKRRFEKLSIDLSPALSAEWLQIIFPKIPMTHRLVILRTITNSWATSHRFNEPNKHVCIFGCTALRPRLPGSDPPPKDDLSHYIRCPVLWGVVRHICGALPLAAFVVVCPQVDADDVTMAEIMAGGDVVVHDNRSFSQRAFIRKVLLQTYDVPLTCRTRVCFFMRMGKR